MAAQVLLVSYQPLASLSAAAFFARVVVISGHAEASDIVDHPRVAARRELCHQSCVKRLLDSKSSQEPCERCVAARAVVDALPYKSGGPKESGAL